MSGGSNAGTEGGCKAKTVAGSRLVVPGVVGVGDAVDVSSVLVVLSATGGNTESVGVPAVLPAPVVA